MGIAEANMVGTAAGLAAAGKIPFVSTFAIFAVGRAWEQMRQSVAYPKANVKIVATHGGVTVGEDGGSHQSVEDIAIVRAVPNMTVIVPADGPETKAAIRAAAAYKGPVYIRLGRNKVQTIFSADYRFEIGKGCEMAAGTDMTFITTGLMTAQALAAASLLQKEGISARVLHIATIKPLDGELVLSAARETGAIVTAEEHSVIGASAGAVADLPVREEPLQEPDAHGLELLGHVALLLALGLLRAHAAAHRGKRVDRFDRAQGVLVAAVRDESRHLLDGDQHRAALLAVRVLALQAALGL